MMMNEHTTKAFDIDLQELARMVAAMGGLAEKQIANSLDALANGDAGLGLRTVALDSKIDALQREIEDKAVLTIAPLADGDRSAGHCRRAAGRQ